MSAVVEYKDKQPGPGLAFSSAKAQATDQSILEFESPSAAVISTLPLRPTRGTAWIVSALVISMVAVSSFIPIDVMVSPPAQQPTAAHRARSGPGGLLPPAPRGRRRPARDAPPSATPAGRQQAGHADSDRQPAGDEPVHGADLHHRRIREAGPGEPD